MSQSDSGRFRAAFSYPRRRVLARLAGGAAFAATGWNRTLGVLASAQQRIETVSRGPRTIRLSPASDTRSVGITPG